MRFRAYKPIESPLSLESVSNTGDFSTRMYLYLSYFTRLGTRVNHSF